MSRATACLVLSDVDAIAIDLESPCTSLSTLDNSHALRTNEKLSLFEMITYTIYYNTTAYHTADYLGLALGSGLREQLGLLDRRCAVLHQSLLVVDDGNILLCEVADLLIGNFPELFSNLRMGGTECQRGSYTRASTGERSKCKIGTTPFVVGHQTSTFRGSSKRRRRSPG